jgi:hypothetical protein
MKKPKKHAHAKTREASRKPVKARHSSKWRRLYNQAFNQAYDEGFNKGFATGIHDGEKFMKGGECHI